MDVFTPHHPADASTASLGHRLSSLTCANTYPFPYQPGSLVELFSCRWAHPPPPHPRRRQREGAVGGVRAVVLDIDHYSTLIVPRCRRRGLGHRAAVLRPRIHTPHHPADASWHSLGGWAIVPSVAGTFRNLPHAVAALVGAGSSILRPVRSFHQTCRCGQPSGSLHPTGLCKGWNLRHARCTISSSSSRHQEGGWAKILRWRWRPLPFLLFADYCSSTTVQSILYIA
jgi:hypothetical protein